MYQNINFIMGGKFNPEFMQTPLSFNQHNALLYNGLIDLIALILR